MAALAAAAILTLLAEGMVAGWPAALPTGVYGLRFDAEGIGPSLILTARFCLAFALGAVLALHGGSIKAAMRRPGLGGLCLAIALALLSCRNETLMAFGATVLIAAVAWTPRLAAAFGVRALVWVGRLSFSLYLVHLPVMLGCVYAGKGYLPPEASLAIGLGLAIPVAAAMAHLVENRAIGWSRAGARLVPRWRPQGPWREVRVIGSPSGYPAAQEVTGDL